MVSAVVVLWHMAASSLSLAKLGEGGQRCRE
jgi:hypothetical protein